MHKSNINLQTFTSLLNSIIRSVTEVVNININNLICFTSHENEHSTETELTNNLC